MTESLLCKCSNAFTICKRNTRWVCFPPSLERNRVLSISRFIIPGLRSQGEVSSQIVVFLSRKIHRKSYKLDSAHQRGLYPIAERMPHSYILIFIWPPAFFLSTLLGLRNHEESSPSFHFLLLPPLPIDPKKTFKTLQMKIKIN